MATTKTVAPALRQLLNGFIDYAGLFPPAKLPLAKAVGNFCDYRHCDYSWLLRAFVVQAADLNSVPEELNGAISALANDKLQYADESRVSSIESNAPFSSKRVVYCEVPTDKLEMLAEVKNAGCYAKIRTGGLKPEAIPEPAAVAAFINACALQKLPFKATAGLHHPIRAVYPLTYESDAPRAVMHGFINVLMAAALAWNGVREVEPVLAEMDPSAFSFDHQWARWRNQKLSIDQINAARSQFIHSVGSCSFEEPVQDLQKLGWL